MMNSKHIDIGIKAIEEAEKIILKYFGTDLKIETKTDNSPVTIADKKAEQKIREILSSAFPTYGFIGEEYGTSAKDTEYTWIIDPIDGTKNFSHNIPFFATELALFHQNKIIMGISNAPVLKKLLYAEEGTGSFLNGNKIQMSKTEQLEDAYISVGSIKYFAQNKKYNKLVQINKDCAGMKGFGDSWSYQLAAEGKLDAIIEAKIKIWDIAAIAIIIQEAGGKITDLNGKPLSFNSTSALAANKFLHPKLLEYFK